MKRAVPVIAAATITGALLGFLGYTFVLSGIEAVAVVQTGLVDGTVTFAQPLLDKMQTAEVAAKIANEAHAPVLATTLPARQYGGNGDMRVRLVSDGSMIEIRVRSSDNALALSAVAAAAQVAMQLDSDNLAPARANLARRLEDASNAASEATELAGKLTARATGGDQTILYAMTMARLEAERAEASLDTLRTSSLPPLSKPTELFASPSITRPLLRTWWIAALVGALAGGAIGVGAALSLWGRPATATPAISS